MNTATKFQMLKGWIMGFESGAVWLKKLGSQKTVDTYLQSLRRHSDWAKNNPDELLALKVEGLKSVNTSREFQAENLMEPFIAENPYKPSIMKSARNATISFYKHNRRPLIEPSDVEVPKQTSFKMPDVRWRIRVTAEVPE